MQNTWYFNRGLFIRARENFSTIRSPNVELFSSSWYSSKVKIFLTEINNIVQKKNHKYKMKINMSSGVEKQIKYVKKIKPFSIDILDHDSLGKVLSFLSIQDIINAEKVCEKWAEASRLALYDIHSATCVGKKIKPITTRGKFLTKLKITNTKFDLELLETIKNDCVNLIDLELNFDYFDGNCYYEDFQNMTSLKTIILHNYVIEKYAINENEFMTCIPIGIENIGIIKSKKKHRRVCTPIFNCDFSRFTNLCKLRLDNWILSNKTMNSLEKFNETLTDLSLIDCIIPKSGQATIPKLTNLETLDLLRINIDDNVMINITHNCRKLYHLNISNCRKLTSTSLTTLKILRNLKELFVNYLPNIDDAVIKTISNLRIFKCKGCKLITDYGVRKIVKKSPNLEELCITDTGISSKTISYPFKIRKVTKNIKVITEDQQK